MIVVTTPDVLALRGVRRMRELWKRLGVREDEDVKIVLNRASRRREIQPDLARKVVGETMAQTTIPADFNALEAAVNTGSPSRMEDNKLRGAFESLAVELDIVPHAEERARATTSRAACSPASAASAARARPSSWACCRCSLIVFLGLWQIGADRLHVRARRPRGARGRARARRRLRATRARTTPYQRGARARTSRAWRKDAQIEMTAATSRSPCG